MSIKIDFAKTTRKIKDINCVNCAPYAPSSGSNQSSIIRTFKELHIPYSRLHDCCGRYGGSYYVDVPNIFRDFDKDPYDENNYDFYYTDEYIKGIIDSGANVCYRLGVTIDWGSKKYRTYPPKDNKKWAVICEHIIKHYNEGWNNGFHYNIVYFEIWNEPEHSAMWLGTKEQYFELYKTAAKHLKGVFPDIKIGGYGSSGFYSIYKEDEDDCNKAFAKYFYDFLSMVKETNSPLDFFSWHTYSDSLDKFTGYMRFVRKTLDEYGFKNIEIHCNEWNVGGEGNGYHLMRNMIGASYIASAMCIMQNTDYVDKSFYYCFSSTSGYNGFFDQNTKFKTCTYYAFKAFGNCHRLSNQVYSYCDNEKIHIVAASNKDSCSVLVSNYDGNDETTVITMDNLPQGNKIYVDYISEDRTPKTEIYEYSSSSFGFKLNLPKYSVVSINIVNGTDNGYCIYN